MSPEKQLIAIAEACGIKWTQAEDGWWDGPNGNEGIAYENMLRRLPNYLNDLNAMHEAEKVLKQHVPAYLKVLQKVVDETCGGGAYAHTATAAQRAEAFLRTIGKWEQSK